jgi:hypothetical protein
MRVREKSRNGEESGWGEFISTGRLRGENTLPINDRDVGIVFPFMSRSASKSGEGRPSVAVRVLQNCPSAQRRRWVLMGSGPPNPLSIGCKSSMYRALCYCN